MSFQRLPFELGEINVANINQLKTINISTLPVRYSDKFYKELIPNYSSEYLKFAFWNGFAVGAICARLESKSDTIGTKFTENIEGIANDSDTGESNVEKKLYIMTINVLAAYRRRGIGNYIFFFTVLDTSIL